MIILVSAFLGGMGLLAILSRRTVLGVIVGIQLFFLGGALLLVLTGLSAGMRPQGSIFAFFIIFGGVAQLVTGYALSVRRFFQKNKVHVDDLRSLKQ